VSSAVAPGRSENLGVDLPALVPASLLADLPIDPDAAPAGQQAGRVRRSVRDWLVDVSGFLLAVTLGLILFGVEVSRPDAPPEPVLALDLAAGSAACLALWLRRRWPVGLSLAMALVGTFSAMGGAAVIISLFTVAVHRRWQVLAAVSAAHVGSMVVYYWLRPDPDLPYVAVVPIGIVVLAAVVAWGMFVRARRQLVLSLRERAVRAELEQQLRVSQARQLERTRIAREMHDVLAHRISLLSMHAGALEFRPDASPEQVSRAAGVIRESAHQALQDLREVIGVLREGPEGVASEPPQPTLADLPALVEESRGAGMRVRARYDVADLASVPTATGRNAYRIVQEALTNARKHAPGAVVDLVAEGDSATGLAIEVRNRPPVGTPTSLIPGGGTGLVGLAERAALAGGRLEHGWTARGEFRLRAWLPWPAGAAK
jgi:signal transduction histidine kinase